MILKKHIPGVLVLAVLLLAEILFMAELISTKLVPVVFLVLLGLILVAAAVGVFFLVWNHQKLVRLIIGTAVTGVLVIVFAGLGSYIREGADTLNAITDVTVEVADVGVYVRSEDPAQGIQDMATYTFGILTEQDRSNTDETILEVNTLLNTTIKTVEYAGLGELADALMKTREVDAIIVNSGLVLLFDDMEGYEDMHDNIREVHVAKIETVVQNPEPSKKPNLFDLFKKDDAPSDEMEEGESNAAGKVFSVYISGIDTRSSELIAKSRSDVNIIATINTETRQVLLVSTPRDFYVPLPISNGVPDKLTHAGIYGVDCSIGTLEMLYNTEIDYYFRVNFTGFEKIIDALGGVTVHSDYTFSYQGYQYYAGENTLDGAEALMFARTRKTVPGGDRQRGIHQMEVIRAVIKKAMSPTLLTNFTEIMASVSGSFETTIPYDLIAELVRKQLADGGEWNIVSMSADGTGDSRRPYSMSVNAYVMIPDQSTVDAAIAKMEQVKNGEIITQ